MAAKRRELVAAERAVAQGHADINRLEQELRHLEKVIEIRDGLVLEVRRGEEGAMGRSRW